DDDQQRRQPEGHRRTRGRRAEGRRPHDRHRTALEQPALAIRVACRARHQNGLKHREVAMGALLNLVERNLHEVQVDADRMLFHIPSSSLFAADAVTGGIIDTLRQQGCRAEDLVQRLGRRFADQQIQETLRELIALELVSDGSPLTPEIALRQVERTALNTVVLNVNTGCNLSCTYCYKEDLDKPS